MRSSLCVLPLSAACGVSDGFSAGFLELMSSATLSASGLPCLISGRCWILFFSSSNLHLSLG